MHYLELDLVVSHSVASDWLRDEGEKCVVVLGLKRMFYEFKVGNVFWGELCTDSSYPTEKVQNRSAS